LVGASQWFIRGPFLVGGVLYGAIAATVVTLFFFPVSWLVAPKVVLVLPTFDLYQYFLQIFLQFFLIMLGSGILLGVTSSAIAVRKYLRI